MALPWHRPPHIYPRGHQGQTPPTLLYFSLSPYLQTQFIAVSRTLTALPHVYDCLRPSLMREFWKLLSLM